MDPRHRRSSAAGSASLCIVTRLVGEFRNAAGARHKDRKESRRGGGGGEKMEVESVMKAKGEDIETDLDPDLL